MIWRIMEIEEDVSTKADNTLWDLHNIFNCYSAKIITSLQNKLKHAYLDRC